MAPPARRVLRAAGGDRRRRLASCPPTRRPSRGWTSPTTASGGTRRWWSRSRTPTNRCIWGCWAPTGPATRASSTTTTGRSRCAARPGSPRSGCGATPTSRSPPSSTAGTPTGCGSSSATTPRPTSIEQPPSANEEDLYHELVTRAERQIATTPRTRPRNVKDEIVRERDYKTLRQTAEDVVEFSYRPGKCKRDYRVVALRKNISVERGENVLFGEYRYFFYITNDWDMTADEVIDEARQRCNQENLISQLKSGVRALHAPVNTLNANWAYMTMAALAWTLKAWCALLLPVTPRWAEHHNEQRRRLLTMDFRTFLTAFINIPCQIITTGRHVRWRILTYNPWLAALFRLLDTL